MKNLMTGQIVRSYDATSFYDMFEYPAPGSTIITHNGARFDFPCVMYRSGHPVPVRHIMQTRKYRHVDTLLLSKIMHPDIECGHSLNALCRKYYPKSPEYWKQDLPEEYQDWKHFYDHASLVELDRYLDQDLEATAALYRMLLGKAEEMYGAKTAHNIMTRALPVEDKVADIVSRQVDVKVRFDVKLAEETLAKIEDQMELIERTLEPYLPFMPLPRSKLHWPPKVQFKADGTVSAHLQKYCDKYGALLDGDRKTVIHDGSIIPLPLKDPLVTSYKLTLANQSALKDYLLDKGWKPTYWNFKRDPHTLKYERTTPRLTDPQSKEPCPNLKKIFKYGEEVSRWLMLRARRNVIRSDRGTGWLHNVDANDCLPSEADTLGTNTGRFSHKGIANIPRVSSPYGKEFRSFFRAREDTVWVGWDASSLEACMEAHFTYPYDPVYAKSLTDGDASKGTDVHTLNMKAMGLPNRDIAKTFKYAVTYGAQPKKLAEQLGCSKGQAQIWYDEFWMNNHGLRTFKEQLTAHWRKNGEKYILGLDGRPITTRSEHSLVNACFQSAGAIVMKYAMILAAKRIRQYAADEPCYAEGLIRYHDEEQWEVGPAYVAPEIGKMGVQSIVDAGRALKLNVPLKAEYNIGNNWAETH